jgi:hypothetical protein
MLDFFHAHLVTLQFPDSSAAVAATALGRQLSPERTGSSKAEAL